MKNDFNYKWSKIFASKRFKREDGFIILAPIDQHELLKDAESLVEKLTLTYVSQQHELLKDKKIKDILNWVKSDLKQETNNKISKTATPYRTEKIKFLNKLLELENL